MSRVRILLLLIFKKFFFFQRNLHFREHFPLEVSPKCDLKVENSSTLCKFHEERKGMGSIMLTRFKCIKQEPSLTVSPQIDSSQQVLKIWLL